MEDTDMNVLKMTVVLASLLMLAGCIVAPYGGPGYYGGQGYYGNSGYGGLYFGGYGEHLDGDRDGGDRGGDH